MARGPHGEWRPDDPIAAAVHTMKIATGEAKETFDDGWKEAQREENEQQEHDKQVMKDQKRRIRPKL